MHAVNLIPAKPKLNLDAIRSEFPIIHQESDGRRMVYLDNAATSQSPRTVLDASRHYYEALNSNIHRGTHRLAREATEAYENARKTIAKHLNAASPDEVIFTSGTTDGINLVASILGLSEQVKEGDEIVISALEHHSNIVPWQMLAERTGAKLRVIPVILETGELDLDAFEELLSEKTKVVAITWVSNALGTITPVASMIDTIRADCADTFVLVDAAQAVPHMDLDVRAIDADFVVFSGHKVYAPTGIGVLWGRRSILEMLPPWRGGGEMIKEVTFEKTTYNDLPFKYEAGTPNIEGAIALGAALDWVGKLGWEAVAAHDLTLLEATRDRLAKIEGLKFYGNASQRTGAVSFLIDGIHHYDLGTLIDKMGVAVRTGHHCCQPLMAEYGITGTVRASFAVYNTLDEIELLGTAVEKAAMMLG